MLLVFHKLAVLLGVFRWMDNIPASSEIVNPIVRKRLRPEIPNLLGHIVDFPHVFFEDRHSDSDKYTVVTQQFYRFTSLGKRAFSPSKGVMDLGIDTI